MAEVASAYVSLMPSAKGFGGKISSQIGGDLDKAGKSGGKRFGGAMTGAVAGGAAKMFAPIAAAAAAVGIGGFFKDAIAGASDLNEAGTKITAIFGKDGAAAVQKFSAGGAKALGQTKLQVLDASANFGTFGKAAGLGGKDLAKFSTGFASLSTDLASFSNTSPEQAVEAIGAALRGEAEPIRQFGVLLDDATLRSEALKLGLIKTTKQALTPQQKVLAAQAAIYKQTKDAQGDFARTSGGLANQQRILSASFSDLKSSIGSALLPVALGFVKFLNGNMIPGIQKIGTFLAPAGDAVKVFFGALSGKEVTTVGPLGKIGDAAYAIRDAFAPLAPVVQRVFATFKSGGSSASALSTAFAGVSTFIRAQVVPAVMGVLTAFKGFISVALPIVQAFVSGMMARITPLLPGIRAVFQQVGSTIVSILNLVKTAISAVTTVIAFIWRNWGQGIMNFLASTFGNIINVVRGALNIVQGIIKTVTSLIKGDWSGAWDGIKQIVSGAWTVIKAVVSQAANIIKVVLSAAWSVIKAGASAAWSGIKAVISAAMGYLKSQISASLNAWKSIFAAGWSAIKSGVSAAWSAIKSTVSAAWSAIKSAVSSGISSVVGVVRGLPGAISGALGNLGGILAGAGRQVIQGFIDGITGAFGAVRSKLGELTSMLPDWKGPSKRDKTILTPAGRLVIRGFIDGIAKATPDVKKQLEGLTKALVRYGRTSLARSLRSQNASLVKLGDQRLAVAKKLKTAQDKFAAATKLRTDFAASVKAQAVDLADVVKNSTATSQFVGGQDIVASLKSRLVAMTTFAADVAKLKNMGLNNAAYQQIIEAGVDGGGADAAAGLLAGGKKVIGQVNTLQGQITAKGKTLGDTSSKVLYQAGIDSAKGLVKGLESQSVALAAAAKRLAAQIVKAIKSALKIKSPSRVMAGEVGRFIPLGIVRGIDSERAALDKSMRSLVAVPRVSDAAVGAGGSSAQQAGRAGRSITINGNVGWDPAELAREADKRDRNNMALAGLAGVVV